MEYHYYLDNKDIATMWGILPFWVRKKEQNALMHFVFEFDNNGRR